jgi:hypothetical protein
VLIDECWRGRRWVVETDIASCSGSLDHQVMLAILAEKIHDGRFLRLISHMLKAGYLEDWRWHATLSGAPQGGISPPVLSDIYLDRLDQFIEQRLLPECNPGRRRRPSPACQATEHAIARARRHKDRPEARRLVLRRRQLPRQDPADPGYRRLRYIRYAGDWLPGFAGPGREAEEIKSKIAAFPRQELKPELSQSKTLTTHATSQEARFLGYEIRARHSGVKITRRRRAVNGAIGLFVPGTVIRQRCALCMSKGETGATRRAASPRRLHHRRGVPGRVRRSRPVLPAGPGRVPPGPPAPGHADLAAQDAGRQAPPGGPRDGPQIQGRHRHPRRAAQVPASGHRGAGQGRKPPAARFGEIPLRPVRTAVLTGQRPVKASTRRNELIHRLLAGRCEICEDTVNLEARHVRKLADLNKPGRREKPAWMHLMAKRRRKTLITCRRCHEDIHAGRAARPDPK